MPDREDLRGGRFIPAVPNTICLMYTDRRGHHGMTMIDELMLVQARQGPMFVLMKGLEALIMVVKESR